MTAPRNRRKGFRIERNPGMKVALTGLSLAGFALGWMGFAQGGHPGDHASAATPDGSSQAQAVVTQAPDVQTPDAGTQPNLSQPDQSQPTPSYSVPTYRTSRGS